jgi:hypothetical protein
MGQLDTLLQQSGVKSTVKPTVSNGGGNLDKLISGTTKIATPTPTKTSTSKSATITQPVQNQSLIANAKNEIKTDLSKLKGLAISFTQPKPVAAPPKVLPLKAPTQPIKINPDQKKLTKDQLIQVNPQLNTQTSATSAKPTVDLKKQQKTVETVDKVAQIASKVPDALINTFLSNTKKSVQNFADTPKRMKQVQELAKTDPKAAQALALKYIKDDQKQNRKTAFELASFVVPFGKAGFLGSKFIVPGAVAGALQSVADESSAKQTAINIGLGAGGGAVLQGAGKALSKVIKLGEHTPEELIGNVMQNNLDKTPEGKALIKTALEAEQSGKNILIDAQPEDFTSKLTTEVKPKTATPPSADVIPGDSGGVVKNEAKIAPTEKSPSKSVKDTNELMTYIDRQGFRTPEQINTLKADIKKYGIKYPIELIEEADGSFTINDGTHRVQIAKDLGIKEIPVKIVDSKKVVKPVVPEIPKPVVPQASGVAKQIEAKAVEKGLIEKGYNELAQYDSSTIKAQSEAATKYTTDEINKFATGELPLPKELKPGTALSIAEDHAFKNNDSELARKLANSPLATQISESASELSLSRMRDNNSPVKIMRDITKAREEAISKKFNGKTPKEATKETIKQIKSKVKAPDKYDWNSFVKGLEC